MKTNLKILVAILIIGVFSTNLALASSGAPTNTTGAKPAWNGTTWTFSATNDTYCDGAPSAGPCEKICLEVATVIGGIEGNWTRYNHTTTGDPDANSTQTSSTFVVTPPAVMKNLTGADVVKYQFYMVNQSAANCEDSSRYKYSGWQTPFNTGPNAVSLSAFGVQPFTVLPFAGAAVAALGGLGGLVLWRRRR